MFDIGLCSTQYDSDIVAIKKYLKGGVYENWTELSKYVCDLNSKNIDFRITLKIKREHIVSQL